ncbi:hypothetical protein BG262_06085 [Floricoccus penangensis]|uniref:HTH arsR-type domain-containing protein n=1 Tax=Floricoccus penangensis TaxID=1859475 RepID=A0A9Q5JF03_9LACT|nr:metalloregulator ArsR/SmtB family transcription factor [Floricoccus penangensis]OFI46051.1 hypothetical protein BG262_06085 [Floricoccus penangensis]
MKHKCEGIDELSDGFKKTQKTLIAIGHETRQYLLMMMLEGPCDGSRVSDIAEKTHLSRPAISHHMQILKNANIVKARKEGTMIYYYVDPDTKGIQDIITLFTNIKNLMENLPDRNGEDW